MSAWQPVLDQLVRERYGRLLGRARLLAGPGGDAEDLVQDALVAVFGARARFASVEQAEQYVRLAMTSRSVDRARRERSTRTMVARVAAMTTEAAPEAAGSVSREVVAALAALAPRERAVAVLRYLDDLSVRETARALGLSEGAVKRYAADAVAALALSLGAAPGDRETSPVLTKEVRRDA